VRYLSKLNEVLTDVLHAGQKQGLFQSVDPMHLVSSFVGATVLFIGVMPTMGMFDPLNTERLEAHREDVLANVRRILGVGKARLVGKAARGKRSS